MREFVRFDSSLPTFIDLVVAQWGEDAVKKNLFLRDAAGRLTFVVTMSEYDSESRSKLADIAFKKLGEYTDKDGFAVATPEELFDDTLVAEGGGWAVPVSTTKFNGTVRVVDRRVVGADWLRPPAPVAIWPPRIIFASLKGGVGRSTALCVLASHLSQRGLRVLTVDMDLEAPGLGNMLLSPETLPEYGLLDYLVETALNPVDLHFYLDMVGHSWLGAGKGTVDVIPALGKNSLKHPVNVLAKIARAYLEQRGEDNVVLTITDRMQRLLDVFSKQNSYDVILLDARAGLHETTASAISGLGGDVFLFGTDQPQTFAAYELLFSHLATLSSTDWWDRLHFVHAKADAANVERVDDFALKMIETMSHHFLPAYEAPQGLSPEELKDTFEIDWKDEIGDEDIFLEPDFYDEPIVTISESADFRDFDPRQRPDRLTEGLYATAFGSFLKKADNLISQVPAPGQSAES